MTTRAERADHWEARSSRVLDGVYDLKREGKPVTLLAVWWAGVGLTRSQVERMVTGLVDWGDLAWGPRVGTARTVVRVDSGER